MGTQLGLKRHWESHYSSQCSRKLLLIPTLWLKAQQCNFSFYLLCYWSFISRCPNCWSLLCLNFIMTETISFNWRGPCKIETPYPFISSVLLVWLQFWRSLQIFQIRIPAMIPLKVSENLSSINIKLMANNEKYLKIRFLSEWKLKCIWQTYCSERIIIYTVNYYNIFVLWQFSSVLTFSPSWLCTIISDYLFI